MEKKFEFDLNWNWNRTLLIVIVFREETAFPPSLLIELGRADM